VTAKGTGVGGFVIGMLFAAGLTLSGMTQPAKIIGFLDIFGDWDPSLIAVLVSAVLTYALGFHFIVKRRQRPVLAEHFALPTRRDIDGRLVLGATLFGMGWGLAGYCPGPALTALGSGSEAAATIVGAMLLGMAIWHGIEGRLSRSSPAALRERRDRLDAPMPATRSS
jgi:uncharacterized membrane protein YedE/YeeE